MRAGCRVDDKKGFGIVKLLIACSHLGGNVMRSFPSAIAVCALLSGCSFVPKFNPTMASDPPLIGVEGQVLQAEMLKVFKRVNYESHSQISLNSPAERSEDSSVNSMETKEKLNDPTLSPEDDIDRLDINFCNILVPSHQETSSKQFSKYKESKVKKEPYDECYIYKKISANSDAPLNYLKSGMALTDYYCDIFLAIV